MLTWFWRSYDGLLDQAVALLPGVSRSGATITAGSGTSSFTASALGVNYSLNEVMAAGSSSTIAQYITSLSCTNNSVAVPGLTTLGQSFTPVAGDNYVCTIYNTPAPTIRTAAARSQVGQWERRSLMGVPFFQEWFRKSPGSEFFRFRAIQYL